MRKFSLEVVWCGNGLKSFVWAPFVLMVFLVSCCRVSVFLSFMLIILGDGGGVVYVDISCALRSVLFLSRLEIILAFVVLYSFFFHLLLKLNRFGIVGIG